MALIDDQGRLFGVVNVIDVLVVLFVVAVVVAGVALLDPFAPSQEATRYATVELGAQPNYLVERVTEGDVMQLENSPDNLTVTDVYRGPGQEGSRLVIRVALNGGLIEDPDGPNQFRFGGDPFLIGQELTIETVDYTVTGNVRRVDGAGDSLPTRTTSIVATTTLTTGEAERLAVGDAYQVDGHSLAVLRRVELAPTPDGAGHIAHLGIELTTIDRGATTGFGPFGVRIGASVPFETADYRLEPEIVRLGTTEIETTTSQAVLQTTVPASVVGDVQAGDTFDVTGDPVATLETVAVYPTADPTTKRVVLGVDLTTRVDGDRRLFAGREVQVGTTLPLRTAAYDLTGEVVRRGSVEPPGEPTTATVTLRLENLQPERAANVRTGQTETVRGETVARVIERTATPAVVILESEDGDIFEREHPRNLDLTLTVELQARQTGTDLRFHGEPVQIGDTVVLDLGDITIRGAVTGIDRG